jgi:hypothetical protein
MHQNSLLPQHRLPQRVSQAHQQIRTYPNGSHGPVHVVLGLFGCDPRISHTLGTAFVEKATRSRFYSIEDQVSAKDCCLSWHE